MTRPTRKQIAEALTHISSNSRDVKGKDLQGYIDLVCEAGQHEDLWFWVSDRSHYCFSSSRVRLTEHMPDMYKRYEIAVSR